MNAVFGREIKSYFTSITGYVFAAFLLVFAGIYVMAINLSGGYPNFEYALGNMTIIFIIAVPILTMRVMAEEKRQRTDQLLYSLPLSMTQVVLGKYFAMLVVIALPLVIIGLYPLVLSMYGNVNMFAAYGSLLAFFLLASSLSAIGMFISSLVENQAASAGICFGVMLLLYFMSDLASFVSVASGASLIALVVVALILVLVVRILTKSALASSVLGVLLVGGLTVAFVVNATAFEGLFPRLMENLSLFERFYVFLNGVFDITGIVYYISVTGLFLFLCVQSLEKRRWNG